MFDLSWLAASGMIVLGAVLQTITGFGFGLIITPLLLTVYDVRTSIILNVLLSFFQLSLLAYNCRRDAIRPVVKNFLIGSTVGIPAGIYIFFHFKTNSLKLLVSSVVLIFCLVLAANDYFKKTSNAKQKRDYKQEISLSAREKKLQQVIGAIAGLLLGSVSLAGPPIILFLNRRFLAKDKFRATASFYFALVNPVTLLLLIVFGAVSTQTFLLSLTLMPFVLLGNALGHRLFPLVPQEVFQKGIPLLVLTTAFYSIFTTIF